MSWLTSVFRRDSREQRKDSWGNVITGLLTNKDKRIGGFHQVDLVSDIQARELWRGDDIAKRVIEVLPREAMRRGYQLKVGDDKELAEEIMGAAEELGLDQAIVKAAQYERAYGGAALFPVIEGAQGELNTPLDESAIGRIVAIHVLEPRELYPASWYTDIRDPKFGRPASYRCTPLFSGGSGATPINGMTYVEIHESRLIIFPGIRVTRMPVAGVLVGWGDNVLTAMHRVLSDYGQSWGTVANLLQDFAQAVLQIDGLDNLTSTNRGKAARDRLEQINLLRSALRTVVIDTKDKFTREQTPLTNLAELLDRLATRLAAAADMPITLLMGMSPAGLNATGESDRAFFYDRVSALQHYITPFVERLLRLVMLSIDGPTEGAEPDIWSIDWNALWAPSDQEIATTRYTNAQADALGMQWGWLVAKEVRSRWAGDGYGDIVLDDNEFENGIDVDVGDLTDEDKAAMGVPGDGDGGDSEPDDPNDATTEPPTSSSSRPGDRGKGNGTGLNAQGGTINGKKVVVRQHQRTVRPGAKKL